jgi:large subunit ribosomal protein L30
MAKKTVKITLERSLIGTTEGQRGTIRALGLKRVRHTVEREDSPVLRGMIDRVRHMVKVEEA